MRNVRLRDSCVMSMAHGLEIRVPFLDHHVVEAAAAMRGRWKSWGERSSPDANSRATEPPPSR